MKDLIEIDRGIKFCHEMQTMSSRHSVGDGIYVSPTFLTKSENKKIEQKESSDTSSPNKRCG
jgi:hypothetical protein